jgi:hypothetical protein
MWAGFLHLAVGNAIIGIGEGLLVAWIFKLRKGRTVWLMVLANYFSAWVGGFFLRGAIVDKLALDLNNAWRWFWIMVVVTYVVTLILEWPLVALCFRGTENWLVRSVRANAIAQTASYVVLFGWYWMASGTSLFTKMHVVSAAELALPPDVVVYFISESDGDVYKRRLTGGPETKVCKLGSEDRFDRLDICANSYNTNGWDLLARSQFDHKRTLLPNLSLQAAPTVPRSRISFWPASQTDFGDARRLGSATNSDWAFEALSWSSGLWAQNLPRRQIVRFSYETPFGAWTVRNAVHLPTDKVLFQLGDNQICAFDPESKRVALLWHGHGPVPVIEKAALADSLTGAQAH